MLNWVKHYLVLLSALRACIHALQLESTCGTHHNEVYLHPPLQPVTHASPCSLAADRLILLHVPLYTFYLLIHSPHCLKVSHCPAHLRPAPHRYLCLLVTSPVHTFGASAEHVAYELVSAESMLTRPLLIGCQMVLPM